MSSCTRFLTTKELANDFGISPQTFRRKIKIHEDKIGVRKGLWTPKQVNVIREALSSN